MAAVSSTLQHETIFACRLPRAEHPWGGGAVLGADGIIAARWWSLAELAACPEEVWPSGLADHAIELLRQDLDPPRPRDLSPESRSSG